MTSALSDSYDLKLIESLILSNNTTFQYNQYLSKKRDSGYMADNPQKVYANFYTGAGGYVVINHAIQQVMLTIFEKKELVVNEDKMTKVKACLMLQLFFKKVGTKVEFTLVEQNQLVLCSKRFVKVQNQSRADFTEQVNKAFKKENNDSRVMEYWRFRLKSRIAVPPQVLPLKTSSYVSMTSLKLPHAHVKTVQVRYASDLLNLDLSLCNKVALFLGACQTIESMHLARSIHGMFTPHNILVARVPHKSQQTFEYSTKLIDFSETKKGYRKPFEHKSSNFQEKLSKKYGVHSLRIDVWSGAIGLGRILFKEAFDTFLGSNLHSDEEFKAYIFKFLDTQILTKKFKQASKAKSDEASNKILIAQKYKAFLEKLFGEEPILESFLNEPYVPSSRDLGDVFLQGKSIFTRIEYLKSSECTKEELKLIMDAFSSKVTPMESLCHFVADILAHLKEDKG